jgi:putative transposase
MRKSKFPDSQVIAVLKRAQSGELVPDACREMGVSSATFCKWRVKFGGMDVYMMARIKELEDERRPLKKMYMDKKRSIRIEFIQPSMPQQTVCVERFNRPDRYEWLALYHFDNLAEVRDFATRWMWPYNHERTNMALGGITLKQLLAA